MIKRTAAYRTKQDDQNLQKAEGFGAKNNDEEDICASNKNSSPDGYVEKQIQGNS